MHKFWLCLVMISGLISIWFFSRACEGLWHYYRLENQIAGEVNHWEVIEVDSSHFAILGSYEFEIKGKVYFGKTLFREPKYLNRFSAESDLTKWKKQSWSVWYHAKNPEISSLQKTFPFKACIHALLTIGITIYFFVLQSLNSRAFREEY